jgi:hypothetical protein
MAKFLKQAPLIALSASRDMVPTPFGLISSDLLTIDFFTGKMVLGSPSPALALLTIKDFG